MSKYGVSFGNNSMSEGSLEFFMAPEAVAIEDLRKIKTGAIPELRQLEKAKLL